MAEDKDVFYHNASLETEMLQRIANLFEGNEEYTDLFTYIDQKIPGLSAEEKLRLVYQSIKYSYQKADTTAYATFIKNLSANTIKHGIDNQIRVIEKFTNPDNSLTEAFHKFLAHGVLQRHTELKK